MTPTPEERDRETALKIAVREISKDENVFDEAQYDAIIEALSTARREGEAEAEAMKLLSEIETYINTFSPQNFEMDGTRTSILQAITYVIERYKKRLEDAERKAWAFDWLEKTESYGFKLPYQISKEIRTPTWCIYRNGDQLNRGYSTLLEAIEAAAKEPK